MLLFKISGKEGSLKIAVKEIPCARRLELMICESCFRYPAKFCLFHATLLTKILILAVG